MDAVAGWIASRPVGSCGLVAGLPREGKSRTMKYADARGAFPQRLVIDPHIRRDIAEYRAGNTPAPPWGGTLITYEQLIRTPRALDREGARYVVDPAELVPKKLAARVVKVLQLVWHQGGYDVIFEEGGLFSRHAVDWLNIWATGCGHVRGRGWFIVQEWARLLADVRDNLNTFICFSAVGGRHLAEIRNKCGAAIVPALRDRKPGDPPVCWSRSDGVFTP